MYTVTKHTIKKYKCKRCGHISEQQTNHYGETYSFGHFNCCPNCPPWAKYPEFGGSTIWECMEKDSSETHRKIFRDDIMREIQNDFDRK